MFKMREPGESIYVYMRQRKGIRRELSWEMADCTFSERICM